MTSNEGDSYYTEVLCWGESSKGQLGCSGRRVLTIPRVCSFQIVIHQISCGYNHSALIAQSGYLYTMGSNESGKLGIGDSNLDHTQTPQLVGSLSKYKTVRVSCGHSHTAAIIDSGLLFAWGDNSYGQIGLGDTSGQIDSQMFPHPQQVILEEFSEIQGHSTLVSEVSCGSFHTIAVFETGRACSFGKGSTGQLGIGSLENQSSPCLVPNLSRIIKVSSGYTHSLFLDEQGKVYSTGLNDQGQLGLAFLEHDTIIAKPQRVDSLDNLFATKVIAGSYSAVLTDEGEVFLFGNTTLGMFDMPTRIAFPLVQGKEAQPIKDIDISADYGLALRHDNKLFSWGQNEAGQLGVGDSQTHETSIQLVNLPAEKSIISVTCGHDYAMCIGVNKKQSSRRSRPCIEELLSVTPKSGNSFFDKSLPADDSIENSPISTQKAYVQSTRSFSVHGDPLNASQKYNSQQSAKKQQSREIQQALEETKDSWRPFNQNGKGNKPQQSIKQPQIKLNKSAILITNRGNSVERSQCDNFNSASEKEDDQVFVSSKQSRSQLEAQFVNEELLDLRRQLSVKNLMVEAQAAEITKLQEFLAKKIAESSSKNQKEVIENAVNVNLLEDNKKLALECVRASEENGQLKVVLREQSEQINRLMIELRDSQEQQERESEESKQELQQLKHRLTAYVNTIDHLQHALNDTQVLLSLKQTSSQNQSIEQDPQSNNYILNFSTKPSHTLNTKKASPSAPIFSPRENNNNSSSIAYSNSQHSHRNSQLSSPPVSQYPSQRSSILRNSPHQGNKLLKQNVSFHSELPIDTSESPNLSTALNQNRHQLLQQTIHNCNFNPNKNECSSVIKNKSISGYIPSEQNKFQEQQQQHHSKTNSKFNLKEYSKNLSSMLNSTGGTSIQNQFFSVNKPAQSAKPTVSTPTLNQNSYGNTLTHRNIFKTTAKENSKLQQQQQQQQSQQNSSSPWNREQFKEYRLNVLTSLLGSPSRANGERN